MSLGPWIDRTARTGATVLDHDVSADIVVVGAGLSGAWLARRLAERHLDVIVLEGRRAAHGASGRNAGFVLADGATPYAGVKRERGAKLADALRSLGIASRIAIGAFARDTGVPFAVTGSLRLAGDEEEAADLRATAAALGEHASWYERNALPAPYRADERFLGGLIDRNDGEIDPVALVLALLDRAGASRARVFEASPVRGFERDGEDWRVVTPSGSVRAPRVVFCTNAWSARILPSAGPILPVRAQMLEARVDPDVAWETPTYAFRGADYWRRMGPGRLLIGGRRLVAGREENVDVEEPTTKVQAALDELLGSLLPAGQTFEIVRRWAGLMGFTPDALPVAGPVPGHDGMFVLAGFNGHGLSWAPALADELTESLAAGATPVSDHFAATRFAYPPRP